MAASRDFGESLDLDVLQIHPTRDGKQDGYDHVEIPPGPVKSSDGDKETLRRVPSVSTTLTSEGGFSVENESFISYLSEDQQPESQGK